MITSGDERRIRAVLSVEALSNTIKQKTTVSSANKNILADQLQLPLRRTRSQLPLVDRFQFSLDRLHNLISFSDRYFQRYWLWSRYCFFLFNYARKPYPPRWPRRRGQRHENMNYGWLLVYKLAGVACKTIATNCDCRRFWLSNYLRYRPYSLSVAMCNDLTWLATLDNWII